MPLEGETPETVRDFFAKVAGQFAEQGLEWAGVEGSDTENLADYGYVQAMDGKFYPSAELATKQNAWLERYQAGTKTM